MRILIDLYEGFIHGVYTDTAPADIKAGEPVEVLVMDGDVEGVPDEELFTVQEAEGHVFPKLMAEHRPTVQPDWVSDIWSQYESQRDERS